MLPIIANVTVTVFGKHINDPQLQLAVLVLFAPVILGILTLVLSGRMVAAGQDWVEPAIFDFSRSRIAPFHVLTTIGKRMRVTGYTLMGAGLLGFLVIYIIVSSQ